MTRNPLYPIIRSMEDQRGRQESAIMGAEQVRAGLSISARTLASFGIDSVSVSQKGVRFVTEETLAEAEEAQFARENEIIGMFGEESQVMKEHVFQPGLNIAVSGNSILIRDGQIIPLVTKRGANIQDRQHVSDREVALFELATVSVLEMNAKSVDLKGDEAALEDGIIGFMLFLNEFTQKHPEFDQTPTLHERFLDLLDAKKGDGIFVRVKGLCVSVIAGETSLFTSNFFPDEGLRFVIAHKMFGKFDSYMSQKYSWFSPSQAMKDGIALEGDIKEEIDDLLADIDPKDTKKLVEMYLSGELGLKYLDMKLKDKREEVAKRNKEQKEDLAEKLKHNLLGVDDSIPDYSSYEVEEETSEVEEPLELEEEEPIFVPSQRKKKTLRKMRY